jgi:formylglycine-generating enzyme required for sulfatase activity
MKSSRSTTSWLALAALAVSSLQPPTAFAQGTAFTYQGQLQNNGSPASGTYNLTFALFNTNTSSVAVAGPVTNNGVLVSNGMLTVLGDFGPGAFTGATNWLEIAVETNGASTFTPLTPRQQLTPTPYAIYAESASTLAISAGMALIPAGAFTMGDTLDGERDAIPTKVYVSAFYMDVNPVSYSQWQSVYFWATNHLYSFDNAGSGKAANHPVQAVNWYDAVKWCNARSQ